MSQNILDWIDKEVVLGDGGYLIELERRGYVTSGSEFEEVGTGKGSGQYTPEVTIQNPDALRLLHQEFLHAGSKVLQALTFYGTRQKLTKSGYGSKVEAINEAAVRIARKVADDKALVAGTISRTQLFEGEGPSASDYVRQLFDEQILLLKLAGVDFLILETFFSLEEMLIALRCARDSSVPKVIGPIRGASRPKAGTQNLEATPIACFCSWASEVFNVAATRYLGVVTIQ